MTALTPDDLARIEELAEKATPGPWHHQPYGGQNQNGDYFGGWIYDEQSGDYVVSEITDQDGAFIAAARTAVPALVAGVRSLQARITELEKQLAQSDRAFNKVYERNAELIMEIWELELKNTQKENDNH